MGCAEETSLIRGGPTLEPAGLVESATTVLVLDIIAHLQRFSAVHTLMGQICFDITRGVCTVLGR